MSKSNFLETAMLELIFNATALANVADNASTSPLTNLYVALHTADPGDAGTQDTNEASYTGYARVAVARNSGGWTIAGDSVTPTSDIVFGGPTAGSSIVTHWSVGIAASGSSAILYSGALDVSATIQVPNTPRLTTATTITEG